MNILITGAHGFVGKNLVAALENIKQGNDKTHPGVSIKQLYLFDIDTPESVLDDGCRNADFVFNLAGVNRPTDNSQFTRGNVDFPRLLLSKLRKYNNTCPVMLSSSVQATLEGRYADGEYGKTKKAGEDIFFAYGRETGAKVLIYRFPNLFGKWCRPNYNSAVATFCYNSANNLPITVTDRNIELELLYIDDLVEEMLLALQGREHRCEFSGVDTVLRDDGRFCAAAVTHKATLGEITDLLNKFSAIQQTLTVPPIPEGSFEKKLLSTYMSYLPAEKAAVPLTVHGDERGSFTELLKTENCGQFSVNISKPGITKGQHWHNTKWEIFVVISGHACIRQRRIGSDEVLEFNVNGEKPTAVYMLPGYTHNIINLSDSEDLITLMWANERFENTKPDTFSQKV